MARWVRPLSAIVIENETETDTPLLGKISAPLLGSTGRNWTKQSCTGVASTGRGNYQMAVLSEESVEHEMSSIRAASDSASGYARWGRRSRRPDMDRVLQQTHQYWLHPAERCGRQRWVDTKKQGFVFGYGWCLPPHGTLLQGRLAYDVFLVMKHWRSLPERDSVPDLPQSMAKNSLRTGDPHQEAG